MVNFFRKRLSVFLLALGLSVLCFSQQAWAVEISGIEVVGNRRIESSTVLAYLPLRVGDSYDAEQVNQALKVLFATGLFSDIKIKLRGSKLIVRVSENPIINRIAFEGNSTIDDETLTPLINLPQRSVYNRSKILLAAQIIVQQYRRQGYYRVRVEPKIIELDQYRVNIVFEIVEGDKNYVQGIYFLGNEVFSDRELRGAIATTESQWWKFLSVSDTYDPDRLEFDKQLLRSFYTQRGYADFSIQSVIAERSTANNGFYISFIINEGKRYRFGDSVFDIKIAGLKRKDLEALIEYKKGAVFNGYKIGKSLEAMNEAAQELGYAFVNIQPDIDYDRKRGVIKVIWHIAEAKRSYVERIEIRGNSHTEDEVIRREFRLDEGDAYNLGLIEKSKRFIRALDFFTDVKIEKRQGSAPDKIVLDTLVTERPTGEISLGVGYSSVNGFIGDFSIRENNFQGKGQVLEAAIGYAQRTQSFKLLFTEPYIFGYRLSFSTNLFYQMEDLQSTRGYDLRRIGGSASIRLPLREDAYLTFMYTVINDDILNVADTVLINAGNTLESVVGYFLTYDRRDDVRKPSDGWYAQFGQDVAGAGGQARYLRTSLDLRFYFPLAETASGKYIFASRFLGGYLYPLGGYQALTQHNFFLGAGSVRGFDRSGLGPRSTDGIARGGRLYGILSNELRITNRIFAQIGLTPIIFLDTAIIGDSGRDVRRLLGSALRDNFGLRMSAGFSLLWESPLGPLRFDFAEVLLKEEYDLEQKFQFQIGVTF